MLTIGDNAYQLHAYHRDGSSIEITIPTASISCITWIYDNTPNENSLPDKAIIYLNGVVGNGFEIWREEARPLYSLIRWGHP